MVRPQMSLLIVEILTDQGTEAVDVLDVTGLEPDIVWVNYFVLKV